MFLVVFSLCIFEIVNSVDNLIVDADILKSVKKSSRRTFMFWDVIFAVLIVRGLLPWLLIFATIPSYGLIGSFFASFSDDPLVLTSIHSATPLLLVGAGTFFTLLFFDWLFRKPKNFAHFHERFFHERHEFFNYFAIIFLMSIIFLASLVNYALILPIFIGSTVFFLLHELKEHFTQKRKSIAFGEHKTLPDTNKLFYLEIMDSVFSVDSVVGAFAFTFSAPLILFGAGLGAIVVRLIAVNNIDKIKKYAYLRNGAMYSIFVLGALMIAEAFGIIVPFWFSPLITLAIISYFFYRSHREVKLVNGILTSKTV